jgi:hypothetical protein
VRLASRVEAPCSHHQYPNLEGLDHQTPRSEPHCFLKYDQKIQIRVSENLVIKYIRREARFVTFAVVITHRMTTSSLLG